MAISSSVQIYGVVSGLQNGTKQVGPITIPFPASPTDLTSGQTLSLQLANGANTITIPSTSCTAAIITFASGSSVTKTLKGASGDTGILLNPKGTTVLTFPGGGSTPANFVITASGADTGFYTEIIFL